MCSNSHDEYEWNKLKHSLSSYKEKIKNLEKEYSISEIEYIANLINQLDAPENIKELFYIQQKQAELGGGFYGIIPEPIKHPEEIPVPDSPENFLELISYLLHIRKMQREAVSSVGFPIQFSGDSYIPKKNILSNSKIKIILDFQAIKEVLAYFFSKNPTYNEAYRIANNEIFKEMVKHRNSLGYVPGPEFTTQYLADFLFFAASKKPVYEVWKWINPWNFFDFADIYSNKERYKTLIETLEKNKEDIESYISFKLEKYTPEGFEFQEKFVFGVEWAIRGWATDKFGGVNIEHVKDNYKFLIDTIIHETFHRIQAVLYPGNNNKEFTMLEKPLQDKKLDAFYKAMTYVFLEGTATHVQKGAFSNKSIPDVQAAVNIFNEIYKTIFQKKEYEKLETLLNEGLRSNGPFYALGHYMSHIIEQNYSNEAIADCLVKGSPEFFKLFLNTKEGKIFPKNISDIIKNIDIPL
ncbi:hypothetical protein JYK00_08230 [Thermosipho ferrireducens]|uniref:DUF4932 domain-containing protein n=1 Tax=Thermosipho ferrireducens TaxID=2571116 RepID=A0ABX7S5B0_9BACT|nr:DUF5700 domain-containing putative Zn-dependent protease [Thermosipho ferrireducens]QTA37702.1 hypothetical protein JYK00_08230 [Thermosipho ferrireducens]